MQLFVVTLRALSHILTMRRAILILAVVLTSCATQKNLPVAESRDSVSVVVHERIVYRDSLIYVEAPSESQSAILADSDTSHLETSLALSEAWVSDGNLNHILQHKPDVRLPKVISIPVYLRSQETHKLAQRVAVKEVEKQLNSWQSFRMTLGTIVLGIVVLWFLIKILKKAVAL